MFNIYIYIYMNYPVLRRKHLKIDLIDPVKKYHTNLWYFNFLINSKYSKTIPYRLFLNIKKVIEKPIK